MRWNLMENSGVSLRLIFYSGKLPFAVLDVFVFLLQICYSLEFPNYTKGNAFENRFLYKILIIFLLSLQYLNSELV